MSAQTTTSQYASPIAGSDGGQRRRWWILAVLGIAQLMVVLDATVVNIALPSALGAFALLRSESNAVKPRIDVPGTLTATGGLFALVYGLANAQTHGWGSSATVGFLAGGVLLLAMFVAIQARSEYPLLPLS